MFCKLKSKKYILPMFQNIIQIAKKKVILLMISNGKRCHYLSVTKQWALLRGITSKHQSDF